MHKQARSASLPFQTFDAPHVTLVTAADHPKKHVWHQQAANRVGYERNSGQHTGGTLKQPSHFQNLGGAKHV
jgi:hypothetical protein